MGYKQQRAKGTHPALRSNVGQLTRESWYFASRTNHRRSIIVIRGTMINDKIYMFSIQHFIHPSIGPSTPVPPSRVPHWARSPMVPGQVARPHLPPASPTSHHPNLSPPPNPNPNIPPPNTPPASTLPNALTCLA